MHHSIQKNHPTYPPLLTHIADPPQKLYWQGNPLNPNDRYFAIVGTRHPSHYGKQMAEKFGRELAQAGFTIVSGLAYGIDAIAHEAALAAPTKLTNKTIAVLGSGLNNITPPCNRNLAQRIAENGTTITEFEPDEPPYKSNFPQRNRIIAGMSMATLIIEAPLKSGALITGRFALEYNREVFVLPGNITQETSAGCNQFIKEGKAFPVTCIQDIFDILKIGGATHQVQQALPLLTEDEEKIYELVKKSSHSIDSLVQELRLPASRINTGLSLLQLKDLITVAGPYVFITR